MSSVRRDYEGEAKITYMSTRAFNLDFFTYTLALNPSTSKYEGTLALVAGATVGNCPKNRFLHETGKKLIPGENPGIRTMLVGVYDPVTLLKGFIDPNSEAFVRMNNDRAADVEALTTADVQNTLGSIQGIFAINPNTGLSDYGQPVYTRGDVIAEGSATITGDITSVTGNIAALAGSVTAYTYVTALTGDVTAAAGNVIAYSNVTATTGSVTAFSNVTATTGNVSAFSNVTATTGDITAVAGTIRAAKQLYSTTVTPLTVSGGVASIDISLGQTFTVASDSDFTINATNLASYAGAVVRCIISNPAGGSQITVTLGTPVRELYNGTGVTTNLQTQTFTVTTQVALSDWTSYTAGPLAVNFATSSARSFQIPDNVTGVITFLCDGTSLLEMSRCLVNGN